MFDFNKMFINSMVHSNSCDYCDMDCDCGDDSPSCDIACDSTFDDP